MKMKFNVMALALTVALGGMARAGVGAVQFPRYTR